MGRYLRSHFGIIFGYFLIIVLIGGRWSTDQAYLLELIGKFLGIMVGVYLLFIDRVVYTYSYPQEQLSQHFVWYMKNKQYFNAFRVLDMRRTEQQKLTFRSSLFMAIWVPLAFFALTSTTGYFGKGVVMGLMLHVIYDMWRLSRIDPVRLNTRLFWQIKGRVSVQQQNLFMIVMTLIFVWFSFWFA